MRYLIAVIGREIRQNTAPKTGQRHGDDGVKQTLICLLQARWSIIFVHGENWWTATYISPREHDIILVSGLALSVKMDRDHILHHQNWHYFPFSISHWSGRQKTWTRYTHLLSHPARLKTARRRMVDGKHSRYPLRWWHFQPVGTAKHLPANSSSLIREEQYQNLTNQMCLRLTSYLHTVWQFTRFIAIGTVQHRCHGQSILCFISSLCRLISTIKMVDGWVGDHAKIPDSRGDNRQPSEIVTTRLQWVPFYSILRW